MIPFAFVLLAASSRIELVNEVVRVAPHQWHAVELNLRQRPALVIAEFATGDGSPRAKIGLIRQDGLELLDSGNEAGFMVVTPSATKGRLSYRVRQAGDYALVVDNRNSERRPLAAELRIWLDFAARPEADVTRLSPQRQITVIVISFAVFFAIVSYSARRLLRGIRR